MSLRVLYDCGVGRRVSEWVCFAHQGYAQELAKLWWQMHGGSLPIPKTAFEARIRIVDCEELKRVVELIIDPAYDQDYPIIVGHRHEGGDLEAGIARSSRKRRLPDAQAVEGPVGGGHS